MAVGLLKPIRYCARVPAYTKSAINRKWQALVVTMSIKLFCTGSSGTRLSVPFSLMSTFPSSNIQNDQF